MQGELGPIGKIMRLKLTAAFNPSFLEVKDESHLHQGHIGAHSEGESHFRVRIAATEFQGLARVAMHRLINTVLAEELKSRVHALAIEITT